MTRSLLSILIFFSASLSFANDRLLIGEFSQQSLDGWESKEFDNETNYAFVKQDGQYVLAANSEDAASGMFRKIEIDLKTYPYLNWRWRIKQAFPSIDETQKENDDYVARIYVVKSGGFFFWKTKALNYVWSSRDQKEAQWPNAYAPNNTEMLAVRSSKDQSGIWYTEKRNVYEDLKDWLGEEVETIHAIAIMTDTDNTGMTAEAYYGDIFFSQH